MVFAFYSKVLLHAVIRLTITNNNAYNKVIACRKNKLNIH